METVFRRLPEYRDLISSTCLIPLAPCEKRIGKMRSDHTFDVPIRACSCCAI
jgi:hypothetical protein